MLLILLVVHLVICIGLIGLVLLQRSEGGALGMGGGGGGSLMSGRGAADALARMTQFAGAFFLATSLGLTVVSGAASGGANSNSMLDLLQRSTPAPATTPAPVPAQPTQPATPDPTESSAPEAATTQLASMPAASASIPAPPPATIAPSPVVAATRAAPLDERRTASSIPTSTTVQRPVTTTAHPAATPTQTVAQRSAAGTTQRGTAGAATQQASAPPHLVIPNTSGSESGALPTGVAALNAESSDPNAVAAVRRERAGPDQ